MSNPAPDPLEYKTFGDYKRAWHCWFKKENPNWQDIDMYMDGKFDNIPHDVWEEKKER